MVYSRLKTGFLLILVFFSVTFVANTTPSWFKELVIESRSGHGLIVDEQIIDNLYESIIEISEKYDLDPLIIIALIKVESEFRNVVGMYGELGLVQIKPQTAQFVAQIYDLSEPEEGWITLLWNYELNIEYGVLYLKYLIQRTSGNLLKALELYNGGSMKTEYANRIFQQYKELMAYQITDSRR